MEIECRVAPTARATITKAEAELLSKGATFAKTKVDVSVAQADLAVATSEAKPDRGLGRLPRAPGAFRRCHRGPQRQYVRLRSAFPRATLRQIPDRLTSRPPELPRRIYVVDRTDVVRIFVDIPEQDANYVHGCDLRLLSSVKDMSELPTSGSKTPSSWPMRRTCFSSWIFDTPRGRRWWPPTRKPSAERRPRSPSARRCWRVCGLLAAFPRSTRTGCHGATSN